MLNNITMGQYYPVDSKVHRLDPRIKLILTIVFIVAVFLAKTFVGYALLLIFVYCAARMANVPFKMLLRGLKPLRLILILTFLLNLFFTTQGSTLLEWQFIRITDQGLIQSVHYSLRLVFLVLCTSIMTLTTSPIQLSDGMELLLSPLKVIHFPAHELAMMMSIALRFIPTLMDETDRIMKAQMARGADFESGNLLQRAKSLIPILVPLFVSSFRIAQDLALAMEARCYRGGGGRTRMNEIKFRRGDAVAAVLMMLFLAVIIASRFITL